MSTELWIALSAFVVVALSFIAFCSGYEYGVKDTERRWSDAVGRARSDT